jgi:peptidoglycan/LPS O-acetylase OafA/YrhL
VLLACVQLNVLTHTGALTLPGFLVSLATTILLAAVSYRFLEMPFLRLRLRFQVVANRV